MPTCAELRTADGQKRVAATARAFWEKTPGVPLVAAGTRRCATIPPAGASGWRPPRDSSSLPRRWRRFAHISLSGGRAMPRRSHDGRSNPQRPRAERLRPARAPLRAFVECHDDTAPTSIGSGGRLQPCYPVHILGRAGLASHDQADDGLPRAVAGSANASLGGYYTHYIAQFTLVRARHAESRRSTNTRRGSRP